MTNKESLEFLLQGEDVSPALRKKLQKMQMKLKRWVDGKEFDGDALESLADMFNLYEDQ